MQLSMVLKAVVSQRLVPTKSGELIPVFEIMTVNNAIQNLIRENKTFQLDNVIYGGAADGTMLSMDNELLRLVREGVIEKATALTYAINAETMRKRLML